MGGGGGRWEVGRGREEGGIYEKIYVLFVFLLKIKFKVVIQYYDFSFWKKNIQSCF